MAEGPVHEDGLSFPWHDAKHIASIAMPVALLRPVMAREVTYPKVAEKPRAAHTGKWLPSEPSILRSCPIVAQQQLSESCPGARRMRTSVL